MQPGDFQSVAKMIESYLGAKGEYFITGEVVKRDAVKKLVWLAEFGDQPIPIVGFDYTARYYDTNELGSVQAKTARIEVSVPAVGASVVVAREFGTRRLPRCLGVIQGIDWILPPED